MTERAVSYEQLLRLAHKRALDGKGGLAASVAKLCLEQRSDLTDRELTLTFEILRMLIDKVEVAVRRNISDYLCERADVPKDLVAFLANDTIQVAYPMLRSSPLLDEFDLMRLIDGQGHGHALAIATRHDLPETVAHKLIDMDDQTIDLTLAKNLTANIAIQDLGTLVDRAVDSDDLHSPLAHRPDLGADLARRLYTVVGDALRRHIVANFDIDSAVVEDALDHAILNALDEPNPIGRALGGGWSEQMQRGGMLPANRVIAALTRDGTDMAASVLAEITHLPLDTARWVFQSADGQTVAVAMKAIGMESDGYVTALDALDLAEDPEEADRLGAYFDRIDAKTAAMVVNHWKTRPPANSSH